MQDADLDRARLRSFLEESEKALAAMERAVAALEASPDDAGPVDTLFRAASTMQGAAGRLGFLGIVEVTRLLEDILERLRRGALAVTPEAIDVLLMSVEVLQEIVTEAWGLLPVVRG